MDVGSAWCERPVELNPLDMGLEEQSCVDAVESRLALLDDLRNAERRAAVSRVASVIAHLIGTPLHVIAGRAALIRSNPETAIENVRRIEEQVDRLALRIRNLIGYLTSPEPSSRPAALSALIVDAMSLYGPIAHHAGITLQCVGEPPDVTVDGSSVMVILTSLFSLAVRVASKDDTISLCFETGTDHRIAFVLSLPGFPGLTTPIDRLDPPDNGGSANADQMQVLSVCHAIARRIGGKLEVVATLDRPPAIRFECPVHASA